MTMVPVQYTGEVIDGLAVPATITSYLALPDTATLAQTQSALDVWVAAMDAVTDAAFKRVYAVLTPTLPGGIKGPTGATWASSFVAQTGDLQFSATGTSRRWGQSIPAFSSAAIVNGKPDLTNADVLAVIALLLNPTGFFTNPSQQSLEAVLDALLTFRKRAVLNKSSVAL